MESNNPQLFELPSQDLEIGVKLPCFLLLSDEIHGACTLPDQCIDDKIPCCRAGKKCLGQERGRVSSEGSSAAVPACRVCVPAPRTFQGSVFPCAPGKSAPTAARHSLSCCKSGCEVSPCPAPQVTRR